LLTFWPRPIHHHPPPPQHQALESGRGRSCRECLAGIAPQGLLQQDPTTLQPSGEAYQQAVAGAASDTSLQGCCGLGCELSIFEAYATIQSECPTQGQPPLLSSLIPMEAYGGVVSGLTYSGAAVFRPTFPPCQAHLYNKPASPSMHCLPHKLIHLTSSLSLTHFYTFAKRSLQVSALDEQCTLRQAEVEQQKASDVCNPDRLLTPLEGEKQVCQVKMSQACLLACF